MIARKYKDALKQRQHTVDLFRIDALLKSNQCIEYETYDLIGIGHPVLGFGATSIVQRFAEQLPIGCGKSTFIFKTASSPHYINRGASNSIIQVLRDKGYDVFHNSILAMACNFFVKYDDRLNKQLYMAAIQKVDRFAEEIINHTPRTLEIHPALEKLLSTINYFEEKKGAPAFAKGLRVEPSCTRCMKCVRDCPTSNISEGQEGMQFGKDCIWCMRCIYSCPKQAIRATTLRSCIVEPYTGGIHSKKLLHDPNNEGVYVTERSKGYYKHFIKYFND